MAGGLRLLLLAIEYLSAETAHAAHIVDVWNSVEVPSFGGPDLLHVVAGSSVLPAPVFSFLRAAERPCPPRPLPIRRTLLCDSRGSSWSPRVGVGAREGGQGGLSQAPPGERFVLGTAEL